MTSEPPVSDGQRIAALTEQVANLQIALKTARRIGTAVGIIMATGNLSDEQAFDLLSLVSQRSALKLRDVAELVVKTGELTVPPKSNESEIEDEGCGE